jgi:quercetin dioxygenase-like cupin family protein
MFIKDMVPDNKRSCNMTKKRSALVITLLLIVAAFAGVTLATPASGILSSVVMARASFPDRVDLKFAVKDTGSGAEVSHVNGAQDTVVQQIVLGPGGHTGWHSHPGPVVVLVRFGELTLYSAEDPTCTGRTYSAGQAFIDSGQGHVHIARNPSPSQNTELWATYFDVPPGAAFRSDAAAPGTCLF